MKLQNSRITVLFVVLGLGILFVLGWQLATSRHDRILWTAPSGESICFLRGYNTGHGHFLALSKNNVRWFLRDISEGGQARMIASGYGQPQGGIPLTSPSWSDDNIIIGLHSSRLQNSVVQCDLRTGSLSSIPALTHATTWNLIQPYSPNGRQLMLTGSVNRGTAHLTGSWLLDSKSGNWLPMRMSEREVQYVGWSQGGDFYLYFGHSGNLFVGNDAVAPTIRAKLPSGFMGGVLPGEDRVLLVQQGHADLKVIRADTRTGKYQVLYQRSGKTWSEANCCGIQCSPKSHRAVVNMSGSGVNPLLIEPDGQVRVIGVSDSIRWRLPAGIAFISDDTIVAVNKCNTDAPDQVVMRGL